MKKIISIFLMILFVCSTIALGNSSQRKSDKQQENLIINSSCDVCLTSAEFRRSQDTLDYRARKIKQLLERNFELDNNLILSEIYLNNLTQRTHVLTITERNILGYDTLRVSFKMGAVQGVYDVTILD